MYKEFGSVAELNGIAESLRKAGKEKEIMDLAIQQGIDEDEAQDYIDGIVDPFATKNMACFGKLRMKEQELKLEGIFKDWTDEIRVTVLQNQELVEKIYTKSLEGCLAEILTESFKTKSKIPAKIAELATMTVNGTEWKMKKPAYINIPSTKQVRMIIQRYYRRKAD